MSNKKHLKKNLFSHYHKSLMAAGLESVNKKALICPLCWEEKNYNDLTLEHIVPKSVGGTTCVLTCKACNNTHGSSLDSHLSHFQSTHDAFKGHGTLRGKIKRNGYKIPANFEWGNGYKNIEIVGNASPPRAIKNLHDEFESDTLDGFDFDISYGYSKSKFQTALLRSAYLALFKYYGYEYAQHPIVKTIRHRISNTTLEFPKLGTLIGKTNVNKLPSNRSFHITSCNASGVELFLVILALKKQTQTNHFVFMPTPIGAYNNFFATMEELSKHLNGEKIHIPKNHMFN